MMMMEFWRRGLFNSLELWPVIMTSFQMGTAGDLTCRVC
jgi:hypothetical protein